MALPLLQTKLYMPARQDRQAAATVVNRPRLLAKLNAGVRGKLTLVSAPAGFGKSTLISAWIADARATLDLLQFSWLSLDNGDNDPIRFWTYFVAALQTMNPAWGEEARQWLQAPQPPPSEAILTLIINEVALYPHEVVLVLDDYHTIDNPAIHQALIFLLDHLPPQLHLFLSSRADPPLPLARWRVRQQLTEIRADDLRFTAAEAAAFLQQGMGLTLAEPEIATLEARTEGWVAGLQLAALALQGSHLPEPPDAQRFITAFGGSNRYIVDYLFEEVLAHQPAEVQSFLLHTAILDQLCAPLCNALLDELPGDPRAKGPEQAGGYNGQARLEQLDQANLFLIPLDNERKWYRYHHLFAEVLRNRLQQSAPGLAPILHKRASIWFEQQQMVEPALHHLLAAGDLEQAANLVEQYSLPLLERQEVSVVRAWLAALPDTLRQRRPVLTLLEGAVWVLTGQWEAADHFFATTALRFRAPDFPRPLVGAWAQLRGLQARLRGDFANAIEYSQEALDYLPADWSGPRAHALINLGLAQMFTGDARSARTHLREAVTQGRLGQSITELSALIGLGWLQTRQGELRQAVQIYQQVIEQGAHFPGRTAPLLGMAYVGLAEILYERNQLAEAQHAATQGIEQLRAATEQAVLALGYGLVARMQAAQGADVAALATLQQAETWLTQMRITDIGFSDLLAAQRVLLWLRQGNLPAALAWATTAAQRSDQDRLDLQIWENLILVRVWLAAGKTLQAVALIEQLQALAASSQWTLNLLELHCLRALAWQQQGMIAQAQTALHQALMLAAPIDCIRTFVDLGEPMRLLLLDVRDTQAPAQANNFGVSNAKSADIAAQASLFAYVDKLLAAFPRVEREIATVATDPSSQSQNHSPANFAAARVAHEGPKAKTVPPQLTNGQNLIEPLSERELEILQLVHAGLSNSAIADQIIVTVGTVKKHLNNIFGKLGVSSRTQALVVARQLDLL